MAARIKKGERSADLMPQIMAAAREAMDRSVGIRKVYLKQFFEEIGDQLRRELEPKHIALDVVLEDRGVGRFD